MSQIIEFYNGRKSDCPYSINDIALGFMDDDWEQCHDFIQWIFPNKEPSQFNDKAPILTEEDIKSFKECELLRFNVALLTNRFMFFLGYRYLFSGRYSIFNRERIRRRVIEYNHNQLRITRLIKFLNVIEMDDLAAMVFKAVIVQPGINETTIKFWSEAYNG